MPAFSGARLRAAREAHHLTREVVAVRAGRSVSALFKFEADTIAPSTATLGRLADAIGCSVATFFEDGNSTLGGAA